MNFVYADAALISELGHFANSCRDVRRALLGRGLTPYVLAHKQVEPKLASELQAQRFFSAHPNAMPSSDPLAGWLASFLQVARITADDLRLIQGLGCGDLVYYNSAKPAQLLALIEWAQSIYPQGQGPRIVIEFGFRTGLRPKREGGVIVDWFSIDAQPIMYRYASLALQATNADQFRFATFDSTSSLAYSSLLQREVHTLPLPRTPITSCRDRSGASPVTIAFLGEQRPDKGFQFVPELAQRLLRTHKNIRLLVHNGLPEAMRAETESMVALARDDEKVELVLGPVVESAWADLLERSDLVVLPYDPDVFASAYSAVAVEAISNAIPVVVPGGTSLSQLVTEYGNAGTVFAERTLEGIAAATGEALSRHKEISGRALKASRLWLERNGGSRLAERLLSLA